LGKNKIVGDRTAGSIRAETREDIRSRAARLSALALPVLPVCASAQTYNITVEHNAAAGTRNGTKLRADIYRPTAEGKFLVLLVRTPYDKTNEMEFGVCVQQQLPQVRPQSKYGRRAGPA
jgi:predicted acyl esterase